MQSTRDCKPTNQPVLAVQPTRGCRPNNQNLQCNQPEVAETKTKQTCFQKDGLSSRSGEAEHEWQCRPVTSTIDISNLITK